MEATSPEPCHQHLVLVVQGQIPSSTFVLHVGEHEVRLKITIPEDGKQSSSLTITANNTLRGDKFVVTLDEAKIAELVPPGFAQSAATAHGFHVHVPVYTNAERLDNMRQAYTGGRLALS